MVDSWCRLHGMEVLRRHKLPPLDSRQTWVLCTAMLSLKLMIIASIAGAGKSVLWYTNFTLSLLRKLIICHHAVLQSSKISKRCAHLSLGHSVSPFFIVTSGTTKSKNAVGCSHLS